MSADEMTPTDEFELLRAAAFLVTFDSMRGFDVDPDVINPVVRPYDETITHIIDRYPDAEPTVDQNPVKIIKPDLKRVGLLNNPVLVNYFELVEEFFDGPGQDQLPITLHFDEDGAHTPPDLDHP